MASKINNRISRIKKELNPANLASQAYRHFRSVTPLKSGNARRNTHLVRNTIEADYAYAQRLDAGYSKQAPDGMTKPTIEWLRAYIKQRLGK
jgi:hypothetical protein